MNYKFLPGKIIPFNYKINTKFQESIEHIINDNNEILRLAEFCKDTRIESELWIKIVKRELLYLYQWTKLRIVLEKKYHEHDNNSDIEHILSLLPAHGLFVHTLRRGLMFAALNIHTEIGFDEKVLSSGLNIVGYISKLFALEEYLVCSNNTNIDKFSYYNKHNNMAIVTGRISTIESLKNKFVGQFIGCAGRCTIAVAQTKNTLTEFMNNLSKIYYPNSCTNLRMGLIYDNGSWYYHKTNNCILISDINKLIKILHPTVIYFAEDELLEYPNFNYLSGYRVVKTDKHGSLTNIVGFSADPKYLWYGDFLV